MSDAICFRLFAPAVAALAFASAAAAQPADSDQRRCILELNKRGAGLVGTVVREGVRCLKRAGAGKEADAQACLVGDLRGKTAKAASKLASGSAKRCGDPLPAFGTSSTSRIAGAGADEGHGLFEDLFGPDLTLVAASKQADKTAAACQAGVARDADKLLATLFKQANAAKRGALKGKGGATPPAEAGELAAAVLGGLAGSRAAKLDKAAAKLAAGAVKRCSDVDRAQRFPGVCAATGTPEDFATCVASAARCRFCQAFARFDSLLLDCDGFDDGTPNASCSVFDLPFIPDFVASTPASGALDVAPEGWVQLDFASPFPPERLSDLELLCEGGAQEFRTDESLGDVVFLIPAPPLPAGASCELSWPGLDAPVAFDTGLAAGPTVLYDRTDELLIAPFPDDFVRIDDPAAPTGKRIDFRPPPFTGLLLLVSEGIAFSLAKVDGFSPLQPLVLAFSDAVDPASVPLTAAESLDAGAAFGLFDADPASPGYGERVPFSGILRSDPAVGGSVDHSLILFPAETLAIGGRYVFVVTRDASSGGQPFGPSVFFERAAGPAGVDPLVVGQARPPVQAALDFLASEPASPVSQSDVALALSITVRSTEFDPSDWVSVKEQHVAAEPPVLDVLSTEVLAGEEVHRGTIELPLFVTDLSLTEITRDETTAEPVSLATDAVPFVFRIPTGAETPMPIVIYQHGSPGSPEEITGGPNTPLVDEGYAVLGLQDVTNRRFSEDTAVQITETIGRLAFGNALPLTNFQTHADMQGLLRAIQGMGVPGNFPEIDPSRILYRGVSFGAHHSLGFLPLAPEVTAAVSHVGSGRLQHPTLHQLDYQNLLLGILDALPGARPRDAIAGLAALQTEQDRDDGAYFVPHLYLDPLAIVGVADTTPPSLLWTEGIGDSLVPNTATRATVAELGLLTVRPVADPSPVLTEVDAPLSDNIATGVTAGHFQYDPATVPSCVADGQTEGHFCGQASDEVIDQMLHFFSTALGGTAEIINPLP